MSKMVKESKLLEQERIKTFKFLIDEYDRVKAKQHRLFKKVGDFYKTHNIDRRNFLKYYHRLKNSKGNDRALLPQKRGPRYKTRRPIPYIENKVIALRLKGNNKYEISRSLKTSLKKYAPSPSGVYNILKRHKLNRMTQPMLKVKRQIIKQKAGELGHIDIHYLRSSLVPSYRPKLYVLALIDDCSRVVCGEIIKDFKALTVMFATLRLFNIANDIYGIKFAEMMSDNGSEFGSARTKNKSNHPFERMLLEMGIKHRYTRPYHPQTNGKIERFWRTLEEDMLQDAEYDSFEKLVEEFAEYQVYYNYERPHQGVNGKTPAEMLESVDKME